MHAPNDVALWTMVLIVAYSKIASYLSVFLMAVLNL
jgi:hypothetical protein